MAVRYTIQDMQEIAGGLSGKCLSKEYVSCYVPLDWMCAKGHRWEAPFSILRQGGWCMQCAKHDAGRERLEEFKKIAGERGGKCLSTVYTDSKTKLQWQCGEKHIWMAMPGNVKGGKSWCPFCVGTAKLTIGEMKEVASLHGGKCLSEVYINTITRLKWQCSKGHVWRATPGGVKSGSWCPVCAGKARHTISEMKELAARHGGRCLSSGYVNNSSMLMWQCKNGHRWETSANKVDQGHWCPACAALIKGAIFRNDIGVFRKAARERGGKLLTQEYINLKTKMTWECSKGHVWITNGHAIKNMGQWCPYCAGNMKPTIADMRRLAKQRGGKCLSSKYINSKTKITWQCSKKHRWEATPDDVKNRGSWCRYCRGNRRMA